MSTTTPVSHNDIIKKIVIVVLPILIITGLIIGAYEYLMSTPLAKGLSGLLGGVSALLAAVGDQLKTCSDNGFFSKGCYMGWLGIGAGLLWGFAKLWDKFSPPKGVLIENLAALQAKTTSEVRDDVLETSEYQDLIKKMNDDVGDESKLDSSMRDAIIQKGFQRSLTKTTLEEIQKGTNSAQEKGAAKAKALQDFAESKESINEKTGLSEDEIQQSDDIVNDTIPFE